VVHDKEEGVVVVDLNHSRSLKAHHRRRMLDQAMQTEDMDNQLFLRRIKERLDRQLPKIMGCDLILCMVICSERMPSGAL
jgi:hypothetical protein